MDTGDDFVFARSYIPTLELTVHLDPLVWYAWNLLRVEPLVCYESEGVDELNLMIKKYPSSRMSRRL